MQADPSRVYLLRSCSSDFRSRGGFRWPSEVGVEYRPAFWDPKPVCGNGLHGFINGEGDAYLADWSDSAQWLVFSAPADEVVAVGPDKAKAAVARIEHVGVGETGADRRRSCLDYLDSIGRLGRWAMGVERRGSDHVVLTGGDYCVLVGGRDSRLTGGRDSRITGGDCCVLVGGDYSHLTGGDYCVLMGGDYSRLTGGEDSRLTGGYGSRLIGGDHSRLAGGDYSRIKGGSHSTLVGGCGSRLVGGPGSTMHFVWWDRQHWRERSITATVGVDGVKPDTIYVAEDGVIVEAAQHPADLGWFAGSD